MVTASDQLSLTFSALADPTRRSILSELSRGERFSLIHADGSSIDCELDEKTFRIGIGQEEAIVNPSTNRLIWNGKQYKKAPSEAGKQLADAAKGALGWVSKNVGSAGKRDQHRIKELAGSWLPLDQNQPPLLISADDANKKFAGGTHSIGIFRDDGFSAKGEFVHEDMMLNLTPDNDQPLSVKVINLTEHELVLSWPDGPVHYQRTHPGVLADYRRARQASEQDGSGCSSEMPSAQATDVTFHDVQIAFVCGSCGSNSTTPPSILEQPMPQAPCVSCGKPNYLPSALNHEGRIYTY